MNELLVSLPPHTHTPTCTHTHAHTHAHMHTGKAHRLKEAKEDAAKEIEDYKKQRETQFQAQQTKYTDSKDDFAQKMKRDTDEKLREIEKGVSRNKEKVIEQLLELVYDIQPKLHRNIKL